MRALYDYWTHQQGVWADETYYYVVRTDQPLPEIVGNKQHHFPPAVSLFLVLRKDGEQYPTTNQDGLIIMGDFCAQEWPQCYLSVPCQREGMTAYITLGKMVWSKHLPWHTDQWQTMLADPLPWFMEGLL